tara:strand:- start:6184 stop:6384 length:201 start_codon:yes stop_codon:yes gene_type:complete
MLSESFFSIISPILYIFFNVDCLELSVGCAVKTGVKVRCFLSEGLILIFIFSRKCSRKTCSAIFDK